MTYIKLPEATRRHERRELSPLAAAGSKWAMYLPLIVVLLGVATSYSWIYHHLLSLQTAFSLTVPGFQ